VIAQPMTPIATGPPAEPRVAAPGTYWPERACVLFHAEDYSVRWRWCVESVTLRPDGEMALRCVWEIDHSFAGVKKGSDEGNRNMYVVDGRGRRYDTVATTEFVKEGGELTEQAPTRRGDFVFRASGPVYSPLTFHDDDQKAAIAGIELDPARTSIFLSESQGPAADVPRRPPAGTGGNRREMVAAAGSGHVETVRALLAAGADPERGDDESGETPLHFAAAGGHTAIVTLLIQAGAQPDTPDHRGIPPLVGAAQNGHAEVVRALLEHRARAGIQDALIAASSAGSPDAVRMLLRAGATVDGTSAYGVTPLMHAAGGLPKPGVVRLLLDSGAAVNATDSNGRTALFIAAIAGTGTRQAPPAPVVEAAKDVVRMLLAAGADPQARASRIGTVMDMLRAKPPESGAREMLAILEGDARR